jgi:metal-responsive CopG/Arc/MetJ family transcriptional regulator
VVDKLDKAWRWQGLPSRTELFPKSLQTFLANQWEADVAAMLATGS